VRSEVRKAQSTEQEISEVEVEVKVKVKSHDKPCNSVQTPCSPWLKKTLGMLHGAGCRI
jgi:ribosomal protein L11